tara:strand:+ start:1065 stop:1379 length:315 start_codon:yes stop_codon:yes gene_type:complete
MGTVYLLAEFTNNSRFKIGITKNDVNKRIRELSTGNSNEIILINKYESVNYRKIEGWLHQKFHMTRGRGEWFDLTHEQVISFTESAKEADEIITLLLRENPFYK